MKIAVTGATGHLGGLVVEKLLETEQAGDIIAVVRTAEKAAALTRRGVAVRVATYDDQTAMETALTDVDRLLLVSSSEVGRRTAQHRNVIGAARRAGVKQLVYTSAPRATTSTLVLAPEHKATEEHLVESGVAYTILRNNWYTENYVPQVQIARETGAIVSAAGDGRVASATRADFAVGAVAVLLGRGHEGKVYELGGDQAWSFTELAAVIAEIIGRPVEYRPVDGENLIRQLKKSGASDGAAAFAAALDTNIADGALAEVTHDLSKLIGRATTPLKTALKASLLEA
ncbi:MAG TPA: SDR family oxidoreductase [Candidatus Limnocylindrales bacterium]